MLDAAAVTTPYEAGAGLPLFVQPADPALMADPAAALAWFEASRGALENVLLTVGAVVLRGFAVPDTAAFGRLLASYDSPDYGYSGGATPRAQVEGRVFEATRVPADVVIGMHQEMAYLPHYPRRLAFWCRLAPASGGETLVADMRKVTAMIDPAFRARVEQRGILYTRNFRARGTVLDHPLLAALHKTWDEAFYTADPARAEAECAAMGLTARWLDDGSLSVTYRAPGLIDHPVTGERLWFNQVATQTPTRASLGDRAELYGRFYRPDQPRPYVTTYGDGSPIAEADHVALCAVLEAHVVAFPWSRGDVMLLDNLFTAHGRNRFTGARDIQVVLLN